MIDSNIIITEYNKVILPGQTSHYGHSHDFYELNFIEKGELTPKYGDKTYILKENQIFIGEPNVFHSNSSLVNSETIYHCFHFLSPLSVPSSIAYTYELNLNESRIMNVIIDDFKNSYISNGSFSKNNPIYDTTTKLLSVLIYKLQHRHVKNNLNNSNKDAVIYNNAVNFMKNNTDKFLTIEDIAHNCGVCQTTVKKIFSKYENIGISTYFMNLKISEAMRLLQIGMSVYNVSKKLGFSSQAYFSSCFKKKVGISPLKYKAENM